MARRSRAQSSAVRQLSTRSAPRTVPRITPENGSYRDLFCWDIAHRSVGACSSGSVSLKRFRAGPPSVIPLVLIAGALGGFRNPCGLRRGRSAATGRAGPALWRAPLTLSGPSGRWRARCAGSRNRRRAHGPSRAPSGAAGALPRASSGRACRIASCFLTEAVLGSLLLAL